jgi:uncharacterized repeat protein (TIGR03809 family)
MTEWQAAHRFAQIAQRWRALVDRRCAHFIELRKSGRWKFFYDEAQFLALMREAADLAETWSGIAPRPQDGNSEVPAKADGGANPQRSATA